jgi:hypothetical protein
MLKRILTKIWKSKKKKNQMKILENKKSLKSTKKIQLKATPDGNK